jgi:hypothetical protein
MRLRFILMAIVVILCATLTIAQYRNVSPTGDTQTFLQSQSNLGITGLRGLLDPARMHMTHSFSMGYASVGGRGVTQGLYMNQIDYRISRPLFLTTHLGYRFQPSGPAEWNPKSNGTDFVGGADLNWCPTNSTTFRFSFYRNMSPSYYRSDFGWGAYDYNPYFYRP